MMDDVPAETIKVIDMPEDGSVWKEAL